MLASNILSSNELLDQVLTVVLSWKVVNTVFTLRDAGLTFGSGDAGIVSATQTDRRDPRAATSATSPS